MANWRRGDYYQALRATPIDRREIDFFRSQPSTKPWVDSPDYSPILSPGRYPQTEREDDLFGRTLNTDDTIQHWLTLVSNTVFPWPLPTTPPTPSTHADSNTPHSLILLRLGSGINGFKDTAHGGQLCALLDEAMGFLVEIHRHTSSSSKEMLYTANLNINYRKPVMTPEVVLLKTWLERREGRKWFLKGVLEDSKGDRCVDVNGLWIAARSSQL